MNMRDYRGSSTYSPEEIAGLKSSNPELEAAAGRQFARDVAGFLTYVCTTQGVPPLAVDGDRKTGGVALVTWSLSNIALLSIMGDPDTLDATSAAVLARYMRTAVLYGTSTFVRRALPGLTRGLTRLPKRRDGRVPADRAALPAVQRRSTARAEARCVRAVGLVALRGAPRGGDP